ncbi:transcriptional protein SWT1 [Ostrinia nubilalis]|uniref:transcriptional protein SWT1 n=1 Tax=Ostrinia nubilalis TaxID=29057 RepID=UPI00308250F2
MDPGNNDSKKLPDGWVQCISKNTPGRKYFFNRRTGKSSWNEPQVDGKQRKRKISLSEKNRREEAQRRNLKRHSDGKEGSPNKKKQKEAPPTPEKLKTPIKKPSPSKPPDSHKKGSPPKPEALKTTPKNSANSRLSQLRAQLAADTQKEEFHNNEKSPSKANNKRISPNASHTQTEPQAKVQKTELKSPNTNDSKCSTNTQSPSSDSFQSIPSPSQFFAANKIISSMKAQLPEEYCNKPKQKDTFADIEEGICNQTAEYPFMKHPATPPQFSEASKLVSAIKSKLSYKVASKETPIKTFSSAKDRMEALRSRLSNEPESDTSHDSLNISKEIAYTKDIKYTNEASYTGEAMDVDCKEVIKNVPAVQYTKDNVGSNNDNLVLVVDTNIFIHELDVIKNVVNSHIKGYSEHPTLLVPWRVINELDRLKDNNNGTGAICKRAKSAMDYLYKSLPESSRIKGQSLRDANSHIYPCEIPDDEILNCCLQQSERGKPVILLSNDKNLCNKAVINGVKCISLNELRPLIVHRPQPRAPDLCVKLQCHQTALYQLLANILENEMRAKYNNLWQHVLFKAPPWSLADVLQCLLKHWVAVFSEVFPRIEHLIAELSNALRAIQSKDPSSLSQSEVSNFKELCLEVAVKCQIIPEYMELAKRTVERISRESETPPVPVPVDRDREMCVINAFEALWTVFSSYCAKISSGLGIPHSLEDKMAEEPGVAQAPLCRDLAVRAQQLARALSG